VGDGAYSVVELGTACRKRQITLIAPLRFDACLYTPPPIRDLRQMGLDFMKRWPVEVTFEETRAHLGMQTQRQWSDLAIERTTPCLLGLYSLVTLIGQKLYPKGEIPCQQTAWYRKQQATFTDVFYAVRCHLWGIFVIRHYLKTLMSF
jgi:hypothetical protein